MIHHVIMRKHSVRDCDHCQADMTLGADVYVCEVEEEIRALCYKCAHRTCEHCGGIVVKSACYHIDLHRKCHKSFYGYAAPALCPVCEKPPEVRVLGGFDRDTFSVGCRCIGRRMGTAIAGIAEKESDAAIAWNELAWNLSKLRTKKT